MIAEAGLAALWFAAALALLQLVLAALGVWRSSRFSVRPELVEGHRAAGGRPPVAQGASTGSARTGEEGDAAKRVLTEEIMAAVRPVAVVQGLLVLLAMLLLITVFARSDMSVLLVAENSHSDKPMLYKIAGAWGNHEGSMLLWVTILGMAGAAVALLERTSTLR